jgi:hypothetical protein
MEPWYTMEHQYADFRFENIRVTIGTQREREGKKKPNGDTHDNKPSSTSSLL